MTTDARWRLPILLLVFAACKSSGGGSVTPPPPPPPAPATMTRVEGDHQTAAAGLPVPVRPAVKLAASDGSPFSGRTVEFAVTGGGGTLSGSGGTQTTDADGIARATWVLGHLVGTNTLTATADATGSPITFTATAVANVAAQLSKVLGDAQTANAGSAVTTPPAVKVVDAYGNAVADLAVTFSVASGGGALTGASAHTGADGVATVGSWTLGNTAGANSLTATAAGSGITGNPATFTATGTAGPATSLTKVAGDNQTALAGQAVAVAPKVMVADAHGNPVGGQSILFSVLQGGGSVTGANQSTASDGTASVGSWLLGAAGGNALGAAAGGLNVTFTATAQAPLNAAQYAGTYTGTWTNTTFSSTGGGTAVIAVNQANSTATVDVDVTGMVLGTGGVGHVSRGGGYGATSAAFTGTVPVMGDITASIDGTGHIIASGINIPNAGISRWDAQGTITAQQIQLSFTVTFSDHSTAVGTITLNRAG